MDAMELILHIVSILALVFAIVILFIAIIIYARAYNEDGFLQCVKLACEDLWDSFWSDP